MNERAKKSNIFFSNSDEKDRGILVPVLIAIPCVVVSVAFLIGALSIIYLIGKWIADKFGFSLLLSDDMQKTIVAVTGAVCVAVLALVGVLRQNKSAERRHMIDANLSLKKDILLQVAESYALQVNNLFSYAIAGVNDEERQKMVKDAPQSFYKLQAVASAEVIAAMLDANKAWMLATFEAQIYMASTASVEGINHLDRFLKIIEITTPFIEKLWRFNIIAREEIRTGFVDDDAYFLMMQAKFSELPSSMLELKSRLG